MTLQYKVTAKTLDKSNGMVTATVDMWDDADPSTVCTDKASAGDLDDAMISAWVSIRAPILLRGVAKLAQITVHDAPQSVPAPPDNPKQKAVIDAGKAFNSAFALAQVKALNDPDTLDKYNTLQAAIADAAKA